MWNRQSCFQCRLKNPMPCRSPREGPCSKIESGKSRFHSINIRRAQTQEFMIIVLPPLSFFPVISYYFMLCLQCPYSLKQVQHVIKSRGLKTAVPLVSLCETEPWLQRPPLGFQGYHWWLQLCLRARLRNHMESWGQHMFVCILDVCKLGVDEQLLHPTQVGHFFGLMVK